MSQIWKVEDIRGIMNGTQTPGSDSWVCGGTLAEKEVWEVERMMMKDLALGIPNPRCPGDSQWAAGNTVLVHNSEDMAAEWSLRCLL